MRRSPKRQPGDVGPDSNADYAKWTRGRVAFQNSPMYLTHGCALQGRLGFPAIEEIGSWDDATLRIYAATHGIAAASVDDFFYFARCGSIDNNYTPPPPTKIVTRVPTATMESAIVAAGGSVKSWQAGYDAG